MYESYMCHIIFEDCVFTDFRSGCSMFMTHPQFYNGLFRHTGCTVGSCNAFQPLIGNNKGGLLCGSTVTVRVSCQTITKEDILK